MKVILKKDMQSLGDIGDVIEVSDGYARNYLLPKNIVEIATDGALKNREMNIERIKAKAEKLHQEALDKAEKVKSLGSVEIEAKAGESGKLFGAVTTKKLAEIILDKSGIEVDRKNILLERPINHVGEYEMKIKFTTKVSAVVNIIIKASEVIKEEIIAEADNASEE